MKEEIIEFFKPDRNKILVSILFPYFLFSLGLLIYLFLLVAGEKIMPDLYEYIATIDFKYIMSNIVYSIMLYPFICSLFAIFRAYRMDGIKAIIADKTTFSMALLGILFFNPISLGAIVVASKLFLFSLWEPPTSMVEVVEISPDTPLKDLEVGDKIYKITLIKLGEEYREVKNNITHVNPNVTDKKIFIIRNRSDFYQAMEEAKEWDSIHIRTLRIIFSRKVPENITDWGIKVEDIEY